nr:MAG TPA: Putative endo-beta-N-acetylglucosaminidase [Caudoviricetes sp.]
MLIKKKFALVALFLSLVGNPYSNTARAHKATNLLSSCSNAEKLKSKYDSTKQRLIEEVDNYIASTSKSSRMTGQAIVTSSIEEEFDITLLLAQCHIEGHFATVGRPKRTNSAFSVGCWDNGKNMYKYKHPDESIEPYIKLIKYTYMKGRNVDQLLNSGFRTKGGARYASASDYVPKIRKCMANIKNSTEIDTLYATLLSLKSRIEELEA